jgi:cytosine/adenosine deaminase-related metal-dependent hydrolase
VDYTIKNALLPVDDGYEALDVQIARGQIAAIAPHLDEAGIVVDGQHKLLLPGFVNAHTHSPEMWQRGIIPPAPLELWIAELYDFTPLDPEQVYLSALGTAVETLLSGGTSLVDHLILIPGQELETIDAAIQAYREVGIRAFVGPLIQDLSLMESIPSNGIPQNHTPYVRPPEASLELLQEAVTRFHRPEEGVSLLAAPTGMQLCSDAFMESLIELSDRHNLCRHTHLLETKAQQILAQERYGCSAVTHMKHLGFLGDRTSLAHCVWLNDADIQILANTHSTVVHNPLSNLRLGSGIAPVLKYRQAGVNVSFGCDGSASNDSQDLLEAIKIGTILHNVTDFDYRNWIAPRQAVEMAALGGARGLGMADQMGSLEVGKQADLVLYDLKNLSLLPRTDPIGLLILGRPAGAVDSVWVRGDRVVADGQVKNLDVDSLRQSLFDHSQWMTKRHSKTALQVESHYRSVLGLPEYR